MKSFIFVISFYLMVLQSYFLKSNALIQINVLGTGLFLPYSLGVVGYIKKNIPIDEYKITGISGGSWCSLLYSLEDDLTDYDKIWDYSIGDDDVKVRLNTNIGDFQNMMLKNLKKRYKNGSVEKLKNMSIITSRFDNQKMTIFNEKISKFNDIEDAINYCSCSSYIPYLSGALMCKEYDNKYYMDGEVTKSLNDYTQKNNTINIHRNMWSQKFKFNNIIYSDKKVAKDLFEKGWEDTERNKKILLDLVKN